VLELLAFAQAGRACSMLEKARGKHMPARMKIDVVSDVSCPWCVIGLKSLEAALQRVGDAVQADVHFQPFELNPDMPSGGESVTEHLTKKYGAPPERFRQTEEVLRARGEQLGFKFDMDRRTRIYNTFDAHRLLHWAGTQGRQQLLKHALFAAYFTQGCDPSNHDVLVELAQQVGLDPLRARQILQSDEYTSEVRERERFYTDRGIHAVPAVIINDRYVIQGGQPVDFFEQTLRRLAGEEAAALR
jgi:predicted DsbA family dithiol-disulfide isomerase